MIVAFPLAWAMVRRGVGRDMLFPLVVNLRALPLIIFAIPLYMMYSVAGSLIRKWGLA
jgi:multiple sugar transport system permease protein